MAEAPLNREMAARIAARAAEAEASFHALVARLVREAIGRGETSVEIRERLVKYFLEEPALREADLYEQERVVAGIHRAIDAALASEAGDASRGTTQSPALGNDPSRHPDR